MTNYWGYRIDTRNRKFFMDEIMEGHLRQGWGWNDKQNLKYYEDEPNKEFDYSAKRNIPIYKKVKKGDILMIPRIEYWDEVVLVRATEDFKTGYKFSIDKKLEDYGHYFPVEFIMCVSRYNSNVNGAIRETLKCRSRFWSINRCAEHIEELIRLNENVNLRESSSYLETFRNKAEAAFNEEKFAEDIYNELNKSTQASEWEFILCEGFKKIFPDNYVIETTSNKVEYNHGADIIIRIPGILNNTYVIAVQVKDYKDIVGGNPVEQINKADDFFKNEEGTTLIDKYVIITKANKEINGDLVDEAEKSNVKILFDKEVKSLLSQMAKAFIGETAIE